MIGRVLTRLHRKPSKKHNAIPGRIELDEYRPTAGPFYAEQEWTNTGGFRLLDTYCVCVKTSENRGHLVHQRATKALAIEFTDRLNQALHYWLENRKDER